MQMSEFDALDDTSTLRNVSSDKSELWWLSVVVPLLFIVVAVIIAFVCFHRKQSSANNNDNNNNNVEVAQQQQPIGEPNDNNVTDSFHPGYIGARQLASSNF
jgi:flagellar basal body-associated protein FliL